MIHSPVVPMDVIKDDAAERLLSSLSLLQLTDSAFPAGRYTHSYGLEAFVGCQLITSGKPATLLALLRDTLRLGVAPSDGVALACAHRASTADGNTDLATIQRADRRLSAVKLARESREASVRIGRSLLGNAQAVFRDADVSDLVHLIETGKTPGNHAVIAGVLTAKLGIGRVEAVAAELFAFSASWVAAAVRLALTDHRVGQRILHRTLPVIGNATLRAISADVEDISSCTPLLDVMSMRHEQAELRLFAS